MDWFLDFISLLCEALTFAIFIRVILSWFSPRPNALTVILDKITEPILAPLRRIIPRAGMFDLTPLAAIILLQLIAVLLSRL
ncbi:MAG TPA: YggT family protein [Dehalococcoidia bacterium]|jgi:YggT family protein|nr:YggT family protein [Dehalococcoidia bacterium]